MIREREDGTSILTVYHQEAEEPEEITVTLSDVELPTVSYEMLEDSIGYLKITEFTMVTPQQFEDAYKDLQAKTAKCWYARTGSVATECLRLFRKEIYGLILLMMENFPEFSVSAKKRMEISGIPDTSII